MFWTLILPLLAPVPPIPIDAPRFGKETVLLGNYPQPISDIHVTSNGKFLFVLDRQRVWAIELSSGKTRSLGIVGPEWLAVSPDGKYIYSGGPCNRTVIQGNRGVQGLSKLIRVRTLALWATNVDTENHVADTLSYPAADQLPVTSAAFSADGKILVTASGKRGKAGDVRLWDVPSGEERLPRIEYKVPAFFDPTGEEDILGLPAVFREPPGVELLALSPDGTTVATVYEGTKMTEFGRGTVRLWDTTTGKQSGQVVISDYPIHSLAFTPDGKTLALGAGGKAGGRIWLWEVKTDRAAAIRGGHLEAVHAVAISPDGRLLASGCAGGTVKLWDLTWRRELHSRTVEKGAGPILSLAFVPGGSGLALAGGNQLGWVRLWEMTRTFHPEQQ